MPIIIPTMDILLKFDAFAIPIIDTLQKTDNEIEKLVELRDWLLPMLMNGQATISD